MSWLGFELHDDLQEFQNAHTFEAQVQKTTTIFNKVVSRWDDLIVDRHPQNMKMLLMSIANRAWSFLHQENLRGHDSLLDACKAVIRRFETRCPEWASEWKDSREGCEREGQMCG